jgi:hypothetical protein
MLSIVIRTRTARGFIALAASSALALGGTALAAGPAFATGPQGPGGLAPVGVSTTQPDPTPQTPEPQGPGPVAPGVDDLAPCAGFDAEQGVYDKCEHPDPEKPSDPAPEDPCEEPTGDPARDLPKTSLTVPTDDGTDLDLTGELAECEVPTPGDRVTFTG